MTGKVTGVGKGNNPKSKEALERTKWKKGEKVRGAGRPIGSVSLKERMAKFLDLDIKVKMPNGTVQDQNIMDSIILSLISQAQKGNMIAIKEVLDRNYGKEPEKIQLEDKELRKTMDEIKDVATLLQKHDRPY